jgi:hypothetical protein
MLSGCLKYFPAALAGVAQISKLGNDKHNPGQPLHHARGKSADHGDCIIRHLTDVQDLLAADERGGALTPKGVSDILMEVSQLAWRALAYSQALHEQFGAPLAPGASEPQSDKPEDAEAGKVADKIINGLANGAKVTISEFKVGDKVRLKSICDKRKEHYRIQGPGWVAVDKYIGECGIITWVDDGAADVNFNDGAFTQFSFFFEDLEPA